MNRFITFFLAYLFTNIALAQNVRFGYVTTDNGTTSTVDVYMFNPSGGSETVLGFSANIYYDNTESSLTSFDTSPASAAGWSPDISSTAHVSVSNGAIPISHTGYGNANVFDLNFTGSNPTSTPIHVLTIHFDNTTGTAAASEFYLASSSEGHPALEYADDFFLGWPIIVTSLPSAGITPDIDPLPDAKGECSVTLTAPTANGGTITATTSDPTSYTAQGTYSVTWTYTDGSNTTTQNQTVIVSDTVLPTVFTQNITVFLNASGNASITPGDIDNGSDDNCGISGYSLDITNFDCSDIGANTVVLTVTDVNSNSRSKPATVTV
ncbi:MAG: hypothetical protein KDD63_03705, partial [Bacteroidetes bacterium]|nr:hypothetical protein [Bacteroidota bacterium]